MILAVPIVAAILLALAFGGKTSKLNTVPMRHLVVIVLGFVVQLKAMTWAADGTVGSLGYRLVLMGGFGLTVLGFVCLRRLPFMAIPLIGLAMNLTVMVANGGTMVLTPDAASADGFRIVAPRGEVRLWGGKDVLRPWDETALPFLSDWLTVRVGSFIRILSPGDVTLATGLGIVVFALMKDLKTPDTLSIRKPRLLAVTGG